MIEVADRRLLRDGEPFFSVGFNYHPSAAGCHYWRSWDAEQIEADLAQMARRGFNTVRFFLFWADFEPAAGQYDEACFSRLRQFVASARRHGLLCVPALLTIWMNGQLFDLPWRQGRNLWTDPELVERELAYVRRVAATLAEADNILAYDLGDEIIHVDIAAAHALAPEQVAAWQGRLADAIRSAHWGALVIQGNEASAITGFHAFRPATAQALDMHAIHGFPVWSPFAIEAIASYKASCFPAFLTRYAHAFGAVLVDELGCYGGDETVARDYLRAALYSVLAAGASGSIVWCWQDFATAAKPYALHPGERFVGLLDTAGKPKPAMAAYEAFARHAARLGMLRPSPAQVGVYIPARYNTPGASYLQHGETDAPAAFYAHLLLTRAHLPFEFTREPLERYSLLICPSVQHITLEEQAALAAYVAQGGVLYYSCADYLHGFGGEELFGVRLHDFTLQQEQLASFTWQGQRFPIAWPAAAAGYTPLPVLATLGAEVLASFPNGSPALLRSRYGRGEAYYLNAPFERQLNAPYRLDQAPWHMLYAAIARRANVRPRLACDSPVVEVALLEDDRARYGLLINHSAAPVDTQLALHDERGAVQIGQVRIGPKDVYLMRCEEWVQLCE